MNQESSRFPSQPHEVVEVHMVDLDLVIAAQGMNDEVERGTFRALGENMRLLPLLRELVVAAVEAIVEGVRITGVDTQEHHLRYPLK